MTNTWSHHCQTNNTFYTLPLSQECKSCGTDHRVQAMRYNGYFPSKVVRKPLKNRIAALLRPATKESTIDEHQNSYYDTKG
jgi:hypothetical protein